MMRAYIGMSHPTLCDPIGCSPPGSSVHGDSWGKNTVVGCHALLQGVFPTQGLKLRLLHLLHCNAGEFFTTRDTREAPTVVTVLASLSLLKPSLPLSSMTVSLVTWFPFMSGYFCHLGWFLSLYTVFLFKSLLNVLQYCFCFVFWFFSHEACGILASWPGIKLAPPALEGKVLTTRPPGTFLDTVSLSWQTRSHIIISRDTKNYLTNSNALSC